MRPSSTESTSGIGLTIGPELITVVRLAKSRSGIALQRAVTRRIPEPAGEEEIVGVLRELVSETKGRGTAVNVAVPRNEITTRFVTLPATDEGDIHRMVRLEVEEFVPYSADELEVDEAILQQLPDGSSKVLVAIAHRDVVNRPVELLRKAGIEPNRVGVSCFELFNAFTFGTTLLTTGSVALVNVSDFGTDILVSEDGRVAFTRGVAHLRAPAATPEEIASELRSSLEAYFRETGGATVDRVLISGVEMPLDAVAGRLASILGLDVRTADFASQAADLQQAGARYAVEIGLALSTLQRPALDVNLVPRSIVVMREIEKKRKAGLVVAALSCLVLLLAYLIVNDKLADKRDYIRFLDAEIAQMEQPAQLVREKKARVDAITAQLSRANSALEVFGKLHEVAPEGLVIEEVRFVRGTEVSVTGQCYDRPIAFAYAERLRGSGVEALARTEVGNTRDERVEGVAVIRFDIRAPMPGAEQAEEELEGSQEED